MKYAVAAALLVCLAACGPKSNPQDQVRGLAGLAHSTASDQRDTSPPFAAQAADAASPADQKQDGTPALGGPPGGPMLAYTYTDGIELPAKQVAVVMKAHEKVCAAAGPGLCQVLGASTSSEGEDAVSAQLSLRAEPHWLTQFRARLEGDAEEAGGVLKSTQVETEDLTRSIVDTEANLRAQKTLRDRLQSLLANRPGKLSELLDVERELARVQGEVDSIQSNLAMMKGRVDMSAMTISYTSAGAPLTDTTFAPVISAGRNFFHIMAMGIGAIIVFAAGALPFGVIAALGFWIWRRVARKRNSAPAAPPSAPG